MRKSLIERILGKIQSDDSSCWIWTGALTRGDYGNMMIKKKTKRAHRVSYELFVGPIPQGLHVLHRCDTPQCINPNHLFVGTQKENLADMRKKMRHIYGEKHHKVKISNAVKNWAIVTAKSGKLSQVEIGRQLGVSGTTICRWVRKKRRSSI